MEDAFCGRRIVRGPGEENVLNKGLWISVVQRKEARLHLNHDPVTRQEDVVDVGQAKLVLLDFAGCQRLRFVKAMDITTAEYLDPDSQLVSGHCGRTA